MLAHFIARDVVSFRTPVMLQRVACDVARVAHGCVDAVDVQRDVAWCALHAWRPGRVRVRTQLHAACLPVECVRVHVCVCVRVRVRA